MCRAFYAEVTGMPLALLGILLLARLLDAGIDPWLGWLADRFPRRRMLALALLPFGLGFVALLNPPGEGAAVWLLGALALTYVGFSAATVAYQAWGADIGSDSGLRTRLTAAREGFGLLGVVLAAALPAVLASAMNTGIARLSWLAAAASATGGGCQFLRRSWAGRWSRFLARHCPPACAGSLPIRPFVVCCWFLSPTASPARCRPRCSSSSWPMCCKRKRPAARCSPSISLPARRPCRSGCGWRRVMAGLLPGCWPSPLSIAAFAGASRLGSGDLLAFAAICLASGLALGADLALPVAIAADLGERQAGRRLFRGMESGLPNSTWRSPPDFPCR